MRLVIVSHTAHYKEGDRILGWGPTVREIDHLAGLFDHVVHIAPLHGGVPPESALPYTSQKVELHPVVASGGNGWIDKFSVLFRAPSYMRAIRSEMRHADVVHVRCPANISMLAVLLLACSRRPRLRWIKYAGNWRPTSPEAWSYTFQRWWLARGPHKACVTVNGRWPQQPAHVHSFYNPCLTDSERVAGREVALSKTLGSPVRLLFVGRLERAKGVERALHVVAQLIAGGTPVVLDLIGDGPARPEFEALIRDLGIDDHVRLHGWIPRPELAPFYGAAHIFLLPSTSSEGWPKVLGEAMAYGAVPVASDISSIPGNLKYFECGRACPAEDVAAYVKAILEYVHSPQQWALESRRAAVAAEHFTYTSYLSAVKTLLKLDEPWIA